MVDQEEEFPMKTRTEPGTASRNLVLTILKWIAIVVPILLVIAYLAVGIVIAATGTTPRREFSPDNNPAARNLDYQEVRFPARGGDAQIAGWYIPHAESQRAIILVPGKDSSRSAEFAGHFVDLAATLHREGGFAVLMIDMRGRGQSSDAHYSFGLNERRDVIGAADWLAGQGFQPGSIGVLGVSYGASAGIGAVADDPNIGALVEDSGFAAWCPIVQLHWGESTGLPDIFMPSTMFATRLLYGYDPCTARPVDEIGRIAPRPVLIIHSTSDVLVPFDHATQLNAAAPHAETWLVTGPEHARSYNTDPPTYNRLVVDFFDRSLKTSSEQ
jgi:dipeptidyl aminopeptidase/acylaminoacyl peptidase